METKQELAKAIIAVMKKVKGIEKSMTVGSGNNSYKGVSDKDVKNVIGEAMAANGLCILPIETNSKTQIDRWEELDTYSKIAGATKQKQSIFTEVETKYLLLHESGESQVISGYGHGIDNQDKGAGKASTYALKYALLYTFLVPTGTIDDTDKTHSDEHATPKAAPKKAESITPQLPYLNINSDKFIGAVKYLKEGGNMDAIKRKFHLSEDVENSLIVESKS